MSDPGDRQFDAAPLLEVVGLKMQYAVSKAGFGKPQVLRAVDGVSFTLARGETLSIVGESGCGKSSIARLIMRLEETTAGRILVHGRRIDHLSAQALRPMRRQVQIVFQDPFSSLNPRMKVRDILAEPVRNFRLATSASAVRQRVADLLALVRLPASAGERFPHEFSEGFVGGSVSGVIDVILQVVEQFVSGGIAHADIVGERPLEDLVEPLIDPGVELAKVGDGHGHHALPGFLSR